MEKKWLCLFVGFLLLVLPLTGARRVCERDLLARALTATGGASPSEVLMALGSVAMNRVHGGGVAELEAALDGAGFRRGYLVGERARAAAEALLGGERALGARYMRFARAIPDAEYVRVGAFYFY